MFAAFTAILAKQLAQPQQFVVEIRFVLHRLSPWVAGC